MRQTKRTNFSSLRQ